MIALGVLILAGLVGAEPAQENELVSYAEAVQCAGLTQAASELEGGESVEGKRLYDAALYWSLAAMQAATAAGRRGLGGLERTHAGHPNGASWTRAVRRSARTAGRRRPTTCRTGPSSRSRAADGR